MSPPKRIFIVEDEGIIAADLEERLVRLGYAIAGKAVSGEEAIVRVDVVRPDVVLMDVILQGPIDGIQAAELISQRHAIPVVYLTAHADELTVRRAQTTGPFGYVLKPFDERELHVAIEIALYRSNVEGQLKQLNQNLSEALEQVKTLRGLLPICAWCKKIQSDDGYWQKLEDYFTAHTGAELTHGICPECLQKNLAKHEMDSGSQ